MSADILGTSWDQCWSMVQYSFTSTETRRLVRTDSPGRPPRLSHSSSTLTQLLNYVRVARSFCFCLMSSDAKSILGTIYKVSLFRVASWWLLLYSAILRSRADSLLTRGSERVKSQKVTGLYHLFLATQNRSSKLTFSDYKTTRYLWKGVLGGGGRGRRGGGEGGRGGGGGMAVISPLVENRFCISTTERAYITTKDNWLHLSYHFSLSLTCFTVV